MIFKDLSIIFKTETTKKFKFSVIVSLLSFLIMLLVFVHGYLRVKQESSYMLTYHFYFILGLFAIGIFTFIIRNYSKHGFVKGSFFLLLKTIVLLISAYALFLMNMQALILPFLYIKNLLYYSSILISITFIKLIIK